MATNTSSALSVSDVPVHKGTGTTGQTHVVAPSITLETAKKIITDLVDKNVEVNVSSSGVEYVERGTTLRFSQLSEGYKSVITWTCDMVARLSETQPNVSEIQDFEGVVLVDEIGLHLHPRWEKTLVKKLRAWFPKVQFFFTTHSSVSILGASDDAVFYRVYKEEGKTKISEPYLKENWKDLMANSVLTSPLFGLEMPGWKARRSLSVASTPATIICPVVFISGFRHVWKTRKRKAKKPISPKLKLTK